MTKKMAPQVEVLRHPSVGGFLTHCGWGSIVEAPQFGVPQVMLPFVCDQGINARLMSEKGLGMEIRRDERGGSIGPDDVSSAVRAVMAGEEGQGMKCRAGEMKAILGEPKLQDKHVDKFVDYLVNNRPSCNKMN